MASMRECVQGYVVDIQRRFARGYHDRDGLDYILFRLDWVINILVRYLGAEAIDLRVINLLCEVKDAITASQCTNSHTTGFVFTGIQRRPKFNIPKEQLQSLVKQRFSTLAIADILGVSHQTVESQFFSFWSSITTQ